MNTENTSHWKGLSLVVLVGLVGVTAVAMSSGIWVLTAVPIGFLFGFFLERSDLCGASAFSEVVVMRDGRKLFGIWVVIVVSMGAFSVGDAFGLIQLNPKPLYWANILIGGIVFGIGIVLAGGCISGVLFKAGQGNLNSMAALSAVPIGIASVLYGPLISVNDRLKNFVIVDSKGQIPTLASITGIPFWVLALILLVFTLTLFLFLRKRSTNNSSLEKQNKNMLRSAWRPWQSGIAIGLLSLVAYMSSAKSGRNYPLGTAEGVVGLAVLAVDRADEVVLRPPGVLMNSQNNTESFASQNKIISTQQSPRKKVVLWMVILVVMLVVGSHLSARLRGSFKLLTKPPGETIVAFIGGILVGAGAALGGGCVVGHIMSGVALMSIGSILFFVIVLIANWVTTRLYLMGISS